MRAYLAKHLRRIADDLDPPAKPANPSPFGFRVTGTPASTQRAFMMGNTGFTCACGQWVGPDDVHGCGGRGTWSYTGTVHN